MCYMGPPEENYGSGPIGAKVKEENKCTFCQTVNKPEDKVCVKCGAILIKSASPPGKPGTAPPGKPLPPGKK